MASENRMPQWKKDYRTGRGRFCQSSDSPPDKTKREKLSTNQCETYTVMARLTGFDLNRDRSRLVKMTRTAECKKENMQGPLAHCVFVRGRVYVWARVGRGWCAYGADEKFIVRTTR